MPTKKIIAVLSLIFIIMPVFALKAETLGGRLKGRILLRVESKGQAWYIEPGTEKRAFLGRPADAFRIMRELGLGITEKDYAAWNGTAPARLAGRILLRVEAKGEAYYANPLDLKLHYLGRPADAFKVMRELGLGVTDKSLNEIAVNDKYAEEAALPEVPPTPPTAPEDTETATEENSAEDEAVVDNPEATTTEAVTDEASATTTSETATTTEPVCRFRADYFKNTDLTSLALTQTEDAIDYDWGAAAPEGTSRTDKFSVRWTATCHFDAGRYRFSGVFNDGVKATIGQSWIFNSWRNSNTDVTMETEMDLEEGDHYLKIEYYDYFGDAKMKFGWEKME
ncbi:MAG: PA14 domain-containing protein [Candidatus Falkowbacteria bacterium]